MPLPEEYDPKRVQDAIDGRRIGASNLSDKVIATNTPNTANVEFKVAHQQQARPLYFQVVDIDKGGVVYRTKNKAWDRTHAYLKCTVSAAKVKLIFFS